jgi:hypothetical protein
MTTGVEIVFVPGDQAAWVALEHVRGRVEEFGGTLVIGHVRELSEGEQTIYEKRARGEA